MMIDNGVMDGVDVVVGLHVGACKSGEIGVVDGASMAASRPFKLEFFGRSTHAATPHHGKDALAAAVRAYTSIKLMMSTELTPMERFICSIGKLNAGTAQNIIPDYAEMVGTIRTFNPEIDKYIIERIEGIAKSIERSIHFPFIFSKSSEIERTSAQTKSDSTAYSPKCAPFLTKCSDTVMFRLNLLKKLFIASQTALLIEPDSTPVCAEFDRITAIQITTAIVDTTANMYFFIALSPC